MADYEGVFLDANVLLRYLVADQEEEFRECTTLIQDIQEGRLRPYISSIVMLEVAHVLFSVYGVTRRAIVKDIAALIDLRGLIIVDETHFRLAFDLHQRTHIKLADCLIATQVPDGVTLVTYDRDFAKLPVKAKTPEQILAS